MAIGTFDMYYGDDLVAYVVKEEPADTSYFDGFMTYMFNVEKQIVGFVVSYDTDTLDSLDEWFKTLTGVRYGNSSISFIQKPVLNHANQHQIDDDLIREYNDKLSTMQYTDMVELDDRKQTI